MTATHKPVQLAIVGGGAAGLFAAAVAAERGVRALLIERKARLGSKVLMTANGRCNFTKDISADQFLADLGAPAVARFVGEAVRECPPRKIIKGLQSLNVPVRRMADGRMFPADGKAATIVHAFGDLLRDSEVPVLTNCPVKGIGRAEAHFLVRTANFDLDLSIPVTAQFVRIGTSLSRRRSPNACTIVAALPSAGNMRPSAMRRSGTLSDLKPEMIFRGGHSRIAAATKSFASPTSARNWSAEMSFVKLQRPFAVISTFEPRRALRSMRTQGILRSAATAAANIPAAPPPTIASFTGLCFNAISTPKPSEILAQRELDLLQVHPLERRDVVLLVEEQERRPVVIRLNRTE